MKKIALTIILSAAMAGAYAQTGNTETGTPTTPTNPSTVSPNNNNNNNNNTGGMNNDGTIQTPSDNPGKQTNPNDKVQNQKTQPIAPDQKSKKTTITPVDPNKK